MVDQAIKSFLKLHAKIVIIIEAIQTDRYATFEMWQTSIWIS